MDRREFLKSLAAVVGVNVLPRGEEVETVEQTELTTSRARYPQEIGITGQIENAIINSYGIYFPDPYRPGQFRRL